MTIAERERQAFEACDWPPGAPFTFFDESGEHDPCYVVMPDGAMLALNHHAAPSVDIARAKFVITACNDALASAEAKEAERAELERAVKQMRAELTMRAKMMVRLRDILHNITDTMEDEGDRIYFGSTNDADTLKDIVREFDDLAWAGILSDAKDADVYATCRAAFKRAEAAEARIRALEEQVAGLRESRDRWGALAWNIYNNSSRDDSFIGDLNAAQAMDDDLDGKALGGEHV